MSAFGQGGYAGPPQQGTLVYAGFWIRALAYIIDGIILGIVNGVLFSSLAPNMMNVSNPENIQFGPLFTYSGLSLLIPAIYTIGFWVSGGATPGKMALGLRVVRSDDGGPLATGQAIGRFLGYFVSSFVFALGFIWVAFDPRKQGWHDKLASTVVVRRAGPQPPAFRG